MKKRKHWALRVVLVLLSFIMMSSSISMGTSVVHVWQNLSLGSSGISERIERTSGSPIAMIAKRHKVQSIQEDRETDNRLRQADYTVNTEKQPIYLIPGGQSIGVQLNTKGVLVVGYHLILTEKGDASPGESAGIRIGDVITKINGQNMGSITDVRQIMRRAEAGRPLQVTVLRQREIVVKQLKPILNKRNGHYQLGLFIRDSASGIGTMTFYDPNTGIYGALGHVISDRDTGQPLMVKDGHIVRSIVQAIDRGQEGKPGEKIAFFPEHAVGIGSVIKNTPFGIYGKMGKSYMTRSDIFKKPLPIATASQVKEGPAKILTVLNGNKVEAFNIRILNSIPQKHPETKGLVIKITDSRLLKTTGGIIQGMSGSPIIQDGRLVGAVTHVFVNDPTSGYGVHIEWMIDEAGLQRNQQVLNKEIAS
ncbi:SpoIVB peptidase [Sporolactobacillus sp. CPB3-1]|uniref:SpoIVB peptidase n=1 Tax=Sporolactobacillus mangiferae TaxID=2940498 RepID=A0ABT0MCH9_9BACL|nr:SpoIVB peptidase [Sporolactobacillus mangiferae]MCL1632579.1 SpoIVB peptidase [Sporolactobacillus mangiferae]